MEEHQYTYATVSNNSNDNDSNNVGTVHGAYVNNASNWYPPATSSSSSTLPLQQIVEHNANPWSGQSSNHSWNEEEHEVANEDPDHQEEAETFEADDEVPQEGPYHFFRSLLQACAHGFHSIEPSAVTPEVRRAMMACQLGLDYIDAMDNNEGQDPVQQMQKLKAVTMKTGSSETTEKVLVPRRQMPRLPAEILLRVFNFVRAEDGHGALASPRAIRTLFSCSLVTRAWNQPANTVLWKKVYLADQPARFGRFVLGSATSKYNKRDCSVLVRVLTVACTDADLSLLSVACHHTSELHSLELLRTHIPDAASYRLLQRLPSRFPSLRSLSADTIHPSAWRDIFHLCQTCPLLSNLHMSFATVDGPDTLPPPRAADFDGLFSCLPFLRSLSLWRVPLPPDEEAIATSLSTHCKNLRAIRIDDCGVNLTMGLIVDIWNKCRNLQCITLRMIRQPPRRPVILESLPTLRALLIDGCWLSDDYICSVGRSAPNIETLYIENDWRDVSGNVGSVVHITDRGILSLAPHVRNLRTVSLVGLMGLPHLTARSVRMLLAYNRNVTALNLARPGHAPVYLFDEALLELVPSLGGIRRLEMYMQTHISESALAQTLCDTPRLVSLGLSGCFQLTDTTVSALPALCPLLERTDIAGANCTTYGLQVLVDRARRLKECVYDGEAAESVQWRKVVNSDDPWSEDVFSPYSVWEREVRRVAKLAGFVY
ncbi:hypothetical protein HDU85_007310 [Gaertneriomyces sp. JEL0708]|nr:hypothetical protein HDU85_007310 [Gaertneriomyces sp. JEL0708]